MTDYFGLIKRWLGGRSTLADAQLPDLSASMAGEAWRQGFETVTHDFNDALRPQDFAGAPFAGGVAPEVQPHPLNAGNRKDAAACASVAHRVTEQRCTGLVNVWDADEICTGQRPCGRSLRNTPLSCRVCLGGLCTWCCTKVRSR